MESSIAVPVHEQATGSTTLADLIGLAAARHGDAHRDPAQARRRVARRLLRRAGRDVSEIGRGLIDLGIEPGDRVAILCATRPEWTYADFGDRRDRRGRRPDLPDELARGVRVGGRQLRRRAIVCEDAAQVAKIERVRGEPARARDGDRDRPERRGERRRAAHARRAARARPRRATPPSSTSAPARSRATSRSRSSTRPAPPARRRAACSATATTATWSRCASATRSCWPGDVAYLFLPLAHSFALLIQLAVLDMGATLAYFGGDPKQIVLELSEVRPTYLPSVPRIFEKLYTLVTAHGDPDQIRAATAGRAEGARAAGRRAAGPRRAPGALRRAPTRRCSRTSARRSAAGCARRRPAPRRSRTEILEFFFACGVPVLEGYGMTETATAATASTIDNYRFGSVGRPLPGWRSGSPTTARCCSRARTSSRATTATTTPRSARSSTAGCTRATSGASTRTATCPSPAARRTSSSPRAART